MSDDTTPAWALALAAAMNDLRAKMQAEMRAEAAHLRGELRTEAQLIHERLERLEVAVDRTTSAIDNMAARLEPVGDLLRRP